MASEKETLLIAGVGALLVIVFWPRSAKASTLNTPRRPPLPGGTPPVAAARYRQSQYPPNAPDTVTLFQSGARLAGVPIEWANADSGVHKILAKESQGWVGRPNYQFGELAKIENRERWPIVWQAIRDNTWRTILDPKYRDGARDKQSSATGLGQLTSTRIKETKPDGLPKYYPSGLNGIGVALEEAAGMLAYIKYIYGTPDVAWARYAKGHEGY